MKLRVITSIVKQFDLVDGNDLEAMRILSYARPEIEMDLVYIKSGPEVIESEYEDALAVPATVEEAIRAEKEGIDAIVINCTADTGLVQCRECVSIPVVAPTQTTMHLAAQLCHKFSVLTFLERVNPRFEEMAFHYGFSHKLASVRDVNIPVSEIMSDKSTMVEKLFQEGLRCYYEDRAHALVLGCTFFESVADKLRKRFESEKIPMLIFEPLRVAVHQAQGLAAMGISHSKLTFPKPGSFKE